MVLPILLRAFPTSSFNEVLPQLPVIAIILLEVLSLTIEEDFVKNFNVSFTLICFGFFLKLLTIAIDAPLLNASFINKFPFLFLPLIAKKISCFLISFELIEALLIFVFKEILFDSLISFRIFNLILVDKFLFLIFILSSISFLSENNLLFFP